MCSVILWRAFPRASVSTASDSPLLVSLPTLWLCLVPWTDAQKPCSHHGVATWESVLSHSIHMDSCHICLSFLGRIKKHLFVKQSSALLPFSKHFDYIYIFVLYFFILWNYNRNTLFLLSLSFLQTSLYALSLFLNSWVPFSLTVNVYNHSALLLW